LLVLVTGLVLSAFLFKDKIIRQFIVEMNKHLNTPVKVGKMDVSVFEQFPKISVVMRDVYVEDSHQGQYPLLTADWLSFQMDPIAVYRGKYTIEGIRLEGCELNLKLDGQGKNNYTVVKPGGGNGEAIGFELRNVSIAKLLVHYVSLRDRQDMTFYTPELRASVASQRDQYAIDAEGEVTSEDIAIEGKSYFKDKTFLLTSKLIYDDAAKTLVIKPSTLQLQKAEFTLEGTYAFKDKNVIDLKTEGKNTNVQTLLSLLPNSDVSGLSKYRSDGDVYFSSQLKGEISIRKQPAFTAKFGFRNARVYHPDFKATIEDASFEGSFTTASISNLQNATLVLNNITARINNQSCAGKFVMTNFDDPDVIVAVKGKFDAAALANFYPVNEVRDVQGAVVADISLEGKLSNLKNKQTAQRVNTQGTVELIDLNLLYGKAKTPLQHLSGSLQFSKNDLALSDVKGAFGHTDFILNGFFKNIITFLLFEGQPVGIETDLQSAHVDLDELFIIAFGEEEGKPGTEYEFAISPNVYLNFNCDVQSLQYKKFKAQDVKGDLLVKNKIAVSRNLSFHGMGGDISLSGIVDAQNNKAIDVVSTVRVTDIHVDSVFYVFENFQQDFIQDKHLKGKATADINMEMTLNQNLRLFPETLIADIGIVIREGQLNNFEPMQKLKKYLDDEGLSRLRFSDLKNDIHIEKKTVYIPQMEIRSNVTALRVSGTHTFAQEIDYHVVTPLRRKPQDADAQFAMEEDGAGQSKLFLKITGTTDNYKISYDTEAVKKKIGNDIKREIQELKDAFKNKGKKKQKELELKKDDYFEWEN